MLEKAPFVAVVGGICCVVVVMEIMICILMILDLG